MSNDILVRLFQNRIVRIRIFYPFRNGFGSPAPSWREGIHRAIFDLHAQMPRHVIKRPPIRIRSKDTDLNDNHRIAHFWYATFHKHASALTQCINSYWFSNERSVGEFRFAILSKRKSFSPWRVSLREMCHFLLLFASNTPLSLSRAVKLRKRGRICIFTASHINQKYVILCRENGPKVL